jgi:ribosomal protein S7
MLLQVPVPVSDSRARFMAMKWIILAAKDKDPKVHFPEKLAWELVDAGTNQVCNHCQLFPCILQDIQKKLFSSY